MAGINQKKKYLEYLLTIFWNKCFDLKHAMKIVNENNSGTIFDSECAASFVDIIVQSFKSIKDKNVFNKKYTIEDINEMQIKEDISIDIQDLLQNLITVVDIYTNELKNINSDYEQNLLSTKNLNTTECYSRYIYTIIYAISQITINEIYFPHYQIGDRILKFETFVLRARDVIKESNPESFKKIAMELELLN